MCSVVLALCFFFFTDTAPTEIYTLSLHDALPISPAGAAAGASGPGACRSTPRPPAGGTARAPRSPEARSEEHTSELQSHSDLVCRLLLEKKKNTADPTGEGAARQPGNDEPIVE